MGVAQSVEHWIVAPVVVGSSPIAHPIQHDQARCAGPFSLPGATCLTGSDLAEYRTLNGPLAQLVEQLTLNQ